MFCAVNKGPRKLVSVFLFHQAQLDYKTELLSAFIMEFNIALRVTTLTNEEILRTCAAKPYLIPHMLHSFSIHLG